MQPIVKTDLSALPKVNTQNYLLPGDTLPRAGVLHSDNGMFSFGQVPGSDQSTWWIMDGLGNTLNQVYSSSDGQPGGYLHYDQTTGDIQFLDNQGKLLNRIQTTNPLNPNPGILAIHNNGRLAVIYRNTSIWEYWYNPLTDPIYAPPILTRNSLFAHDRLLPNDSLISTNQQYRATYQSDGNFVVYDGHGGALWSTSTNGTASTEVLQQADGNLVMYNLIPPVRDASGRITVAGQQHAVWALNLVDKNVYHPGSYTRMDDDGILRTYDENNNVVWAYNSPPAGTSVPMTITQTSTPATDYLPACLTVFDFAPAAQAESVAADVSGIGRCGSVAEQKSGCGLVFSGYSACAAVFSGASIAWANANVVGLCGADTAVVGICGIVASLGAASVLAASGAGACGGVAAVFSACGAVYATVGASVMGAVGAGACAAEACSAVACGAAVCGAAAEGASACGAVADGFDVCGAEASGVNACGSNVSEGELVGMCGSVTGFCGIVLCVALPIGGNW